MRHKVLRYSIAFIHGVLTINTIVAALLVFLPHFYHQHFVLHILWTVFFILVVTSQKVFKACPLTLLEKRYIKDQNNDVEKSYEESFIIFWVKRLSGITIPPTLFNLSKYAYVCVLIVSWFMI